jgi:putative lipoic acid-binding regulatory protein
MADEPNQNPPGEKKPLIEYPTIYEFKVMGRREDGFEDWVRLLFGRLIGSEVSRDSITENVSKQGNYVSLRVTVFLQSEAQRQAIYGQLHREKRILYYL